MTRGVKIPLAAIAVLAAAMPAMASDAAAPAQRGVWKGKIGNYPVIACLSEDGMGRFKGAYYYLSRLSPIGLMPSDDGLQWLEHAHYEESGATWRALTIKGDALSGEWTQDGRTLRIALSREAWTPAEEFEEPCMAEPFLAPRAGGGSVVEGDAALDGQPYRTLTYTKPTHLDDAEISSFALLPQQPGDGAINTALASEIPDGTYRSELMQCMGQAIGVHGADGYYGSFIAPTLITARWVNVRISYESYCGGAHPSHGYLYRAYDRQGGAEADLFRWLSGTMVEHVPGDTSEQSYDLLQPAMCELILARPPVGEDGEEGPEPYEPECREVALEEEFWTLGLSEKGMLFIPSMPHALTPCVATFSVPWDELEPALSEKGRAEVAALRGH